VNAEPRSGTVVFRVLDLRVVPGQLERWVANGRRPGAKQVLD